MKGELNMPITKEDFVNLLQGERGMNALLILKQHNSDFSAYSCSQQTISRILENENNAENLAQIIDLVNESNLRQIDIQIVEFERKNKKDEKSLLDAFFKEFENNDNKKRLFILMGETGVGKSYLIEKRYPNITTYACNSSLDPYSLCYYLADKDGSGLKPYETPFLKAVKGELEDNRVLLDEGNELPRDTLMFIQGLTDEKSSVVIGDKLVRISPKFKIIMTANPPSRTDERNSLGDALLGRAVGFILELTDNIISDRLKVSISWIQKVRQLYALLKANRFTDIRELDYRDFDKFSKYDFQSQLKFKVCQGDVENIRDYKRITELGEFQKLLNEILIERMEK